MSSTATAYSAKPHLKPATAKALRVELVDALRGFAIFAIMLLHNLEHFDFYYFPENLPAWIKSIDKNIWDTLFFLFAGKAYGIPVCVPVLKNSSAKSIEYIFSRRQDEPYQLYRSVCSGYFRVLWLWAGTLQVHRRYLLLINRTFALYIATTLLPVVVKPS